MESPVLSELTWQGKLKKIQFCLSTFDGVHNFFSSVTLYLKYQEYFFNKIYKTGKKLYCDIIRVTLIFEYWKEFSLYCTLFMDVFNQKYLKSYIAKLQYLDLFNTLLDKEIKRLQYCSWMASHNRYSIHAIYSNLGLYCA